MPVPVPVPRRLLGLAGVAVLLLGCHAPSVGGRSCSLVGSVSGIQVFYRSAHPHRTPPLKVRACLGSVCQTGEILRHHPRLFMVGGGQLHDATPVTVDVTIADSTGHVLFHGRTQVTPHKQQPNGPDCPPTTWDASVVASGRHTLTAS